MHIHTTNVEHEMCDYTGNNWRYRNSNKRYKEKLASHARKTFNELTTKDSCTWNITRNAESTAVWTLKHEWWGSQLVQEETYRGENDCDNSHHHHHHHHHHHAKGA